MIAIAKRVFAGTALFFRVWRTAFTITELKVSSWEAHSQFGRAYSHPCIHCKLLNFISLARIFTGKEPGLLTHIYVQLFSYSASIATISRSDINQ
jgi:hypothetical protein